VNFLSAIKEGGDIRRSSDHSCRIDKDYITEAGICFISFNQFVDLDGECLINKEDLLANDWEIIDFYEKKQGS